MSGEVHHGKRSLWCVQGDWDVWKLRNSISIWETSFFFLTARLHITYIICIASDWIFSAKKYKQMPNVEKVYLFSTLACIISLIFIYSPWLKLNYTRSESCSFIQLKYPTNKYCFVSYFFSEKGSITSQQRQHGFKAALAIPFSETELYFKSHTHPKRHTINAHLFVRYCIFTFNFHFFIILFTAHIF